jgi:hypothetical protein
VWRTSTTTHGSRHTPSPTADELQAQTSYVKMRRDIYARKVEAREAAMKAAAE